MKLIKYILWFIFGKKEQVTYKSFKWFRDAEWRELNRIESNGRVIQTVTCTSDNYKNLYESQFNTILYGKIYHYSIYKTQ